MKLVHRASWGAPTTSPAQYIQSTKGVKIHYLGTPYTSRDHAQCDDQIRAIRAAHLKSPEGYSDIAYNALVCEHGHVFEGRGLHKKTGANGNQTLNSQHYAVCALLGSSGFTKPTDAMLNGLVDAIEWLRREGDAGPEVKGHRDGHPTACPGNALYAWVSAGAPRPGVTALPPVSLAAVVYAATHPQADEERHPEYADDVRLVQDALVARKRLRPGEYRKGVFGVATRQAYAAEQRSQGFSGADADGVPGKTSLTALGRGRFTVTY
jgi:hypothetical protein